MRDISGNVSFVPKKSAAQKKKDLVCLNFKVPLDVRQRFKVCAARHNLTMTELLLQLFENCLSSDVDPADRPLHVIKK